MKKFIIPLLLILSSTSQTVQADIYKWTDKEGKVHYSATPPKKVQNNVENIGNKIKQNIGKVQPASRYKTPVTDSSTTDKNPSKTAKKEKNRYKGDRSPARLAHCNNLKNNIHTLENSKNIQRTIEGQKETLSSRQIAEQLTKDRASLEKNCMGL